MNSTRLVVIVMLIAVCFFGWIFLLRDISGIGKAGESALLEAEKYRDERLYELSCKSYQSAIAEGAGRDAYDGMLEVCRSYYDEDLTENAYSLLEDAYTRTIKAYPKDVSYREAYIQMLFENEKYQKCLDQIKKAEEKGVKSECFTDYKLKLYYMFRSVGISYDEISPLIAEGYYAVGKNGLLGLLNKNGETVVDITHEGYCAVGTGGTICCVLSEEEAAVYDKDFTMIRRFSGPIKTAFGYSDGRIPVLLEGREDWCYLDDSGKEAAGGFLTAGMFQNGRAAVQYSDGTWGFIDTTGAPVGSERYEEIRLDSFGRWCSASRCVLKKNEKWHLCAENGSEIGSIAADDMDICCGEAVAYAVNGKWGFLSVNGETVIEPSYEAAHSFSGNVAAVCENGLWGFINRNNTLVVDYQFGNAGYFSNVGTGATCPVFIDQMWKLIAWKLER